jgi:hypothetical protein
MRFRIFFVLAASLLASPVVRARTIQDIPAAKESLLRIVSPRFYQSLVVSPVETWVTVRGTLFNDHLSGPTVVRSESGDEYDRLALELANNLQIVDYTRADTSSAPRSVLVHLLVYQIADGTMAMSFAHFEGSGANQLRYSGAAWMAVRKGNAWETIEPRQLTPHERRGPRTYTLAVEPVNGSRSLQGNGRPPITAMSIQGAGVSAHHSTRLK